MSKITTAIIFTNQKNKSHPLAALFTVGGRTLLERQIIQLSRQGVTRFYIISEETDAAAIKGACDKANQYIEVMPSIYSVLEKAPRLVDQACLFTHGSMLLDERITAELITRSEETLLAYQQCSDGSRTPFAIKAPLENPAFGSLAQLAEHLGPKTPAFNVESLPTYIANRRRDIPILAHQVSDPDALPALTDKVLDTAQKGTLDWPARWIHPYFENMAVKLLLPSFVTPNMITLLTGILGFWITYLFATGQMVAATIGAMLVGVLDGVDGKLARTKMLESNVGELEHLLDKAVEYSWYFAMSYYFASTYGNAVWGLAVIAVFFAWAETVQGEFYRRLTGVQLDDAGTFEKYWRLIGGRRNTFIWSFLPFAVAGYAYEGLWMIALYSLITFFVAQFRFIVRFKSYASTNGAQIAKNWTETAYF